MIVLDWFKSFLFTLVIEVPVFILLSRGYASVGRRALAGAAGTCLTHPLLWFVWTVVIKAIVHNYFPGVYWYGPYLVSGELIVAVVESFTFFAIVGNIPLSRAIAASFIANAASFGVGQVTRVIWPGLL
jgi:hypothetical protein